MSRKETDLDNLLTPKYKEHVKGAIDILYEWYESKIAPSNATEKDALDYIPLFTVNGALLASLMNVTYDEYLLAVDGMIRVLDLEADPNGK